VKKENTPAPETIIKARASAGLTQTQAAAVVHTTCRVWQRWEAGDRKMHPAFFELFQLKSKAKPPGVNAK
jgi:putative transcriptional regulator